LGDELDAETDLMLAEVAKLFGARELAVLVRKAAGFSDRELNQLYGISARDIERLLARLADCVRKVRQQSKNSHDE